MIRYLGYPCINMNLSDNTTDVLGNVVKIASKDRVFTSRTIRMFNFSIQKANELALQNSKDLIKIIKWNVANDIHFFRISSNMFPFIDHPKLTYDIENLPDASEIIKNIKEAGTLAKENSVRLTCHPGPYTCLASPNPDVVNKSILSIEKHADVARMLDTKDFAINIHIGGNYGRDYIKTSYDFCKNFRKLSTYAQSLITVENDDKPNMWSVSQLYDYVFTKINIPIVLDIHHWKFNNSMPLELAAELALSTWGNRIPKMHYSESRPNSKPQAHSDYIEKTIPEFNGLYDVMLETKQKDKALLKYKKQTSKYKEQ